MAKYAATRGRSDLSDSMAPGLELQVFPWLHGSLASLEIHIICEMIGQEKDDTPACGSNFEHYAFRPRVYECYD